MWATCMQRGVPPPAMTADDRRLVLAWTCLAPVAVSGQINRGTGPHLAIIRPGADGRALGKVPAESVGAQQNRTSRVDASTTPDGWVPAGSHQPPAPSASGRQAAPGARDRLPSAPLVPGTGSLHEYTTRLLSKPWMINPFHGILARVVVPSSPYLNA